MGYAQCSADVQVNDFCDGFRIAAQESALKINPGHINEHIEPKTNFARILEQAVELAAVRDVAGHPLRGAPEPAKNSLADAGKAYCVAIGQKQVIAAPSAFHGKCAAQPARCAGDQHIHACTSSFTMLQSAWLNA
ncbi:hypothetical protein SDC9_204791 [bioreactor metagenome]|uniref:Uncharacterized protein n=1 Tax=bioreactor metagenome TaxID=1076179 RepID=A0A645J115_9ZZZZ